MISDFSTYSVDCGICGGFIVLMTESNKIGTATVIYECNCGPYLKKANKNKNKILSQVNRKYLISKRKRDKF